MLSPAAPAWLWHGYDSAGLLNAKGFRILVFFMFYFYLADEPQSRRKQHAAVAQSPRREAQGNNKRPHVGAAPACSALPCPALSCRPALSCPRRTGLRSCRSSSIPYDRGGGVEWMDGWNGWNGVVVIPSNTRRRFNRAEWCQSASLSYQPLLLEA